MPANKNKSKGKRTSSKKPRVKKAKKATSTKAQKSSRKKLVRKKQAKKGSATARSVRPQAAQRATTKGSRSVEGSPDLGSSRLEEFRGASRTAQADSESVDELVEEGNLFEAGAVAGVEEADNADEREVHTRELQEDDVPKEYLDNE